MDDDTNYESGDEESMADESRSDEDGMNYASDDESLPEDDKTNENSPTPQVDYTILKEEEIAKMKDDYSTEVSTVLSISKSDACLLLLHFSWSVVDLQGDWFCDEDKIREKVGLLKKPTVDYIAGGNQIITCGICFEKFNCRNNSGTSILSASCGHPYCLDCWKGYISTSIYNGGSSCLMLRCPEPPCTAAVSPDLVQKVLLITNKEAEYDKYKRFLLRSVVEDHRNIKWCPNPNCNHAVRIDGHCDVVSSYDVSCLCSYSFCWNCTEENHSPVKCETVRRWILKNKDDGQNVQWLMAYSKPCPSCKKPIEKNQGCNHMRCRCGHEFCWLCLGSRCRCNMYKPSNIPEEEKDRRMAKKFLEKYIHYYERWANNGKSKEIAVEDLRKVKDVHIQELGEIQGTENMEKYNFIVDAWKQIIVCRQMLKWTYAYGYYMNDDERVKRQLFECLQGEAGMSLEWLHRCAEIEVKQFLVKDWGETSSSSVDLTPFYDFEQKLTNLTSVTGNHFKKLVRAMEEGLTEASDCWICERCTLINSQSARMCRACNSCVRCTFEIPDFARLCEMCELAIDGSDDMVSGERPRQKLRIT